MVVFSAFVVVYKPDPSNYKVTIEKARKKGNKGAQRGVVIVEYSRSGIVRCSLHPFLVMA